MRGFGAKKGWWLRILAIAVAVSLGAVSARAEESASHFDIAAQPLAQALLAFGDQADLSVIFSEDIALERSTAGVTGAYTRKEALERLLVGTGLVYEWVGENAIAVTPPPANVAPQEVQQISFRLEPMREEIVVTARRREESLQETPISISAFSGDELLQQSVQFGSDLEAQTPNFIQRGTTRNDTFGPTMRGIPGDPDLSTTDQSVSVYLNEVHIARGKGLNQAFYDIDRVEILHGPQGTLFGRNSMGGAVVIHTQKPTNQWGDGYLRAYLGQHNRRGLEGATSIPITEDLSARLAFSRMDREGWVRMCIGGQVDGSDCTNRQNLNDINYSTWRASFLWEPTDNLATLIVYDHFVSDQNGTPGFLVDAQPGFTLGNLVSGFTLPALETQTRASIKRSHPRIASERRQEALVRHYGVGLTTTYEFEDFVGKLILSTRKLNAEQDFGLDGTSHEILFTNQDLDDVRSYSAELHFHGTAWDDRLDWIAGLYYFYEDGQDGSTSPALVPINPARANTFNGDFRHKSQAVFTEFTYHFPSIEGLSLTAGGRWTRDDRDFNAHHNDAFGCTLRLAPGLPRLPADQCNFKDGDTWAEPTYNFTLQYQLSDRTNVYLAHRHGYRAGGYNLRGQDGPTLEPFNQETVTDLEFGLKTDFDLGNVSMRTNLAAFYSLYGDIQRSETRIIPGTNSLVTVLTNAAEADIWGGELEVTAQTDRLTLRSALGIAVGRYKEFKMLEGGGGLPIVATDRKGERIVGLGNSPASPDWTLSSSIRYRLPTEELFDGLLGPMAIQLDYVRYQDHVVAQAKPAFGIPARNATYYLMNARIDWTPADGDYEIAIWMKNILDRYYETGSINFQEVFGYRTLYIGDPRLWGVDITYRF